MNDLTATAKLEGCRILIYSHDTFGLGHLRRCRTIAHALVDAYKGVTVLILSGSPIIGQFDFKARVDFIRIPGVIKLHNGDYTALGLHISLDDTLALRDSIILHTAKVFAPDIFLVDKEPGGLKGEVLSTLKMLKDKDTCCILGLRDVMDEPEQLREEWRRKKVQPTLQELYDEIWIYGPPVMGNPIKGAFDCDESGLQPIYDKCTYTGFLQRELPEHIDTTELDVPEEPYILVTPGGGGDGVEMVEGVLRAYEQQRLPLPALIVLGPFMPLNVRDDLLQRASQLEQVTTITFTPNFEVLMKSASAVIAMGGYNTFCELLSFDKAALIVPRIVPRLEQLIRAEKAERLGLVKVLHPEKLNNTDAIVEAIQNLLDMPPPSSAGHDKLLNGLPTIIQRVANIMSDLPSQQLFSRPPIG